MNCERKNSHARSMRVKTSKSMILRFFLGRRFLLTPCGTYCLRQFIERYINIAIFCCQQIFLHIFDQFLNLFCSHYESFISSVSKLSLCDKCFLYSSIFSYPNLIQTIIFIYSSEISILSQLIHTILG